MRTLFHSLRMRLLLAIVGVAAVSLTLAGWLFSRVTVVRLLEHETSLRSQPQPEISGTPLEEFHRQYGTWAGVQPLLTHMAGALRVRLILTGPDRKVLATSSPDLEKAQIEISTDGGIDIQASGPQAERMRLRGVRPVELRDGGAPVGALYALPPSPVERIAGNGPPNPEGELSAALNRGLMMVIAVVLVLATAVALWLARRIVAPVENLRAAVEKMRGGDLQQRVRAESADEIGELGRAFNAMSDRLAHVEKLRRDMISDVAHELRTPLTNIRAQIEAVQDGLARPEPAVIASLHEEVLHLGRLVDDLQDLSLGDAGQLRIERQRLSPVTAIEQAIGGLQRRADERGITVERNNHGTLTEISADPVRLGQILRNLLENAIRHTPRGGHIFVAATAANGCVDFVVSDSGSGIAPEHLGNIFERFYRTDPSRTRGTGGAGLGLAIVKQLVEAHGGSVHAESTPGAGATFRFSLPVEFVAKQDAQ